MRIHLIIANWKMHKGPREATELATALAAASELWDPQVEVVVCPPFVSLTAVANVLQGSRIALGAQNVHWEDQGAFTGEISAAMILTIGCTYAILGHSERRALFGESDESVNRKVKAVLTAGLRPVICVGESLDQRESGRVSDIVLGQVETALQGVDNTGSRVAVAYEPLWAIGTGHAATAQQANEVHQLIRQFLTQRFGKVEAGQIRILYGGSVSPDNASGFFSEEHIDGALVGGASLKAEVFSAIVNNG